MGKNISIFKKIKIFKNFKRTIKSNKNELEKKFNTRVDNACRLYTVINIPKDIIGEPYNLRRSDIDKFSEKFIQEYSSQISDFLNSKGLRELYDFYKIDKVDKYSYLIVIGFSLFRSDKYYNNIYYKIIPAIVISFILTLILLL